MIETFSHEAAEVYEKLDLYGYETSASRISGIVDEGCAHVGPKSVLEVGVGTGKLAEKLLRYGFYLEGLDHSPGMLAIARRRLPEGTLLHEGDVGNFYLPRSFTAVVSHAGPFRLDSTKDRGCFFETYLQDESEVDRAASLIARHLTKGGVLVLSSAISANASEPCVSRILSDGNTAVSRVIESGERRTKIRELRRGAEILVSLEHRFLVLSLERMNEIFSRNGFERGHFDASGRFYVMRRGAF